VSPTYWLLPDEADLFKALKVASDLSPNGISFNPSLRQICDLQRIFIFTESDIVSLPLSIHFMAARAAQMVFPVDDDPFENAMYAWGMECAFELASNLSCLRCKEHSFQYVVFSDSFIVLKTKEVRQFTRSFQDIVGDLLDRSGDSIRKKCNWSTLNDERFEILCYELVRRDGRFEKEQTKKMGVSRSRDGGRDIITKSIIRAGQLSPERQSWIIQCKFSVRRKSLGRDDVRISDLIDEFNPSGIIIATNMLIDAGTYDKYERIQQNRGVTIECWDGLYMERCLNRNPDLFEMYMAD
jgi:hypothetical protein